MKPRDYLKKTVLNQRWLHRYAVGYCANNNLLHDVFLQSNSEMTRKELNLPSDSVSTSQLNQDIFALLVNRFKSGFFVEIGANDGYTLSNTSYLERYFNWNGILIEPNPRYWNSLGTRKSIVCKKAIAKEVGTTKFFDAGLYGGVSATIAEAHSEIVKQSNLIDVETDTLINIFTELNAPKEINFISIDVEGGEIPIVEQLIALKEYSFTCGCIEHGNRKHDKTKIIEMLTDVGNRIMWPENSSQDIFFVKP